MSVEQGTGLRFVRRIAGAGSVIASCAALFGAQGCINRPAVPVTPSSTTSISTKIRVQRPDKIDLLFVVDNSASMKDKQSELGRRIPELIATLADQSVDPLTGKKRGVVDMHVAVISTSLGSHGTGTCAAKDPTTGSERIGVDDRGHLLPRAAISGGEGWKVATPTADPQKAACPATPEGAVLSWVADRKADESAMFTDAADLQTAASCVVQSALDQGCGYEAVWESAYHFLIDPKPYAKAEAQCSGSGCTNIKVEGVDDEILAQRAKFLRPDSLLAVVVLSDENDFSLQPIGEHYKPWNGIASTMPRAKSACAKVPDDFEPNVFGESAQKLLGTYGCAPCAAGDTDPACTTPWPKQGLNVDWDWTNMRGFHQVQRFGKNFLWPRERYVAAFTQTMVPDSTGTLAKNPLFATGHRTTDLVLVAGIVGVPKNLVSDAMGNPKDLSFGDWEKITSADLAKRDPHMIESIGPRPSLPKFGGDRTIDPVHGGDRDQVKSMDLQYACIAPRATDVGGDDCDGTSEDPSSNPLCAGKNSQPYFKAYPGLRHLRILQSLGASGFVASICNDTFRPAIKGITDKIKFALDGQCFKSVLHPDPKTEAVDCLVMESFATALPEGKTSCDEIGEGYCTPGAAPCRLEGSSRPPLPPELAVTQLMLPISVMKNGAVVNEKVQPHVEGANVYATGSDGKKHLVCELMQLTEGRVAASDTQQCLHETSPKLTSAKGGWCYTKDATVVGPKCLDKSAPGTLRFVGDVQPKNGSEVITMCQSTLTE